MNQDKIKSIVKELLPYVIIIIVAILIRTYIGTPVRVNGASMNDTLKDGDILILNKLDKSIERFDIVVVKTTTGKIVKRVIALPGENIEYNNDKLYINGHEMSELYDDMTSYDFTLEELYGYTELPEDYYFVMGDNRNNSSDSRDYRIGLVKKSQILGTASVRLFPFNKIGTVK